MDGSEGGGTATWDLMKLTSPHQCPPPAANPGNPRQIAAELSSPVAGYITVLPTSVQIWEKYTKL